MKTRQFELTADEMITEMAIGFVNIIRRCCQQGADTQTTVNIIESALDGLQKEWVKSGLTKNDAEALRCQLGQKIADEGLKADLLRTEVAGHA